MVAFRLVLEVRGSVHGASSTVFAGFTTRVHRLPGRRVVLPVLFFLAARGSRAAAVGAFGRISQQDAAHHRAVHAGRIQRCGGARDRIRLAGQPQPDGGGREQGGRWGHHRLSLCGEVAAGRPCHADRAGVIHHGPASVAQSGLQSGRRFCGGQPGRRRAVRHGCAGCSAGADGPGVHRAGEEIGGQVELRLGRRRHAAASRRRAFQDACRSGPRPCAVPRRHGGPAGFWWLGASTCSSAPSIRSCR